ncbi:MAG: cytochrome c [Chloroflexi bacterium]|nr:cytochrome c [Chloroflexota bacterium]
MKRTSQVILIFLVGNLLLAACIPLWRGAPNSPMNPGRGWWGSGNFASNGEQIYFTATNQNGERIAYSGGAGYGGMMMSSASLTCASCHGVDGRGGEHVMHMDVMDAPDIRYTALNSEEEHEEEGGHDGEYDLETFRQAVVNGQHPDGALLDRDMPRWQMSDQDLADLLEYLKTLP